MLFRYINDKQEDLLWYIDNFIYVISHLLHILFHPLLFISYTNIIGGYDVVSA